MKVVYCLIDSTLSGGMERSICCKANYLADVIGYDVTIITTDKANEENFYTFSPNIKFVHLSVNYNELDKLSFFDKMTNYLKKRNLHKKRLSSALLSLQPDVTISTYTHEFTILSDMKVVGKKIVEIHTCKSYKNIEYSNRSKFSLDRTFALLGEKRKQQFFKKYDSVVVLTKKDKEEWGNKSNMEIIPNITSFYPEDCATTESKRVISVGRLTYIKGYDLLIEAWSKVVQKHPDWKLSIFGSGEEHMNLDRLIYRKGLLDHVHILSPSTNIENEYLSSSFYVMSSLAEGFGLVLTEAMACGLPCVSFNSPNGPAEIIKNGEDGLLVEYMNVDKLADAILFMIEDKTMRKEMGKNARNNVARFFPERIMPRWITLFENITGTSEY